MSKNVALFGGKDGALPKLKQTKKRNLTLPSVNRVKNLLYELVLCQDLKLGQHFIDGLLEGAWVKGRVKMS